ncbi:hypothetical protein TCAL_14868 [Tigriopus californicus]|uniref:Uncharacterized protein n=1 Tax=Tigriopus californicus TaxID=6832 RepID=A0A553P259_TIGCA|nr:hypothetical protein TCAL_14868 [Tigriopus californicus]
MGPIYQTYNRPRPKSNTCVKDAKKATDMNIGLVNGILCCSGGILAPSSKSKLATYTVTATFHPPSEISEDSQPIESSSSPTTMTQYQGSAKDFKASSILSTMSSLSSTSTMSGDYHPWSPQLSSSPPYTTSIPEESESESGMVCPTCHSSLADCRDGFCASVWTRKDRGERPFLPMHRPIQI